MASDDRQSDLPSLLERLPAWLLRLHHWLSDPPPDLNDAERDVYAVIRYGAGLALVSHLSWIFLFLAIGVFEMAVFNVVSVLTFAMCLSLTRRGRQNRAMVLGTIEIMAHAWVATAYVGWASGFHFHALLALLYCYLLSISVGLRTLLGGLQIVAYSALALYGAHYEPFIALSPKVVDGLVMMNIAILTIAIMNTVYYYLFAIQRSRRQLREQNKVLAETLTQLQAAPDQMVAQQKLAYLGSLTAGIAHEIKNPMNFVNNFARFSVEAADELRAAVQQLEVGDTRALEEIRELANTVKFNAGKIREHGARADRVLQGMLLHSGKSTGEREAAHLNSILLQSIELANSKGYCKMTTDLEPDLPPIMISPRDVARALLNIIGNAVHAACEHKRGEPPEVVITSRSNGAWQIVKVRDNGPGIPEELRHRIFEPFFTTKPTGVGTGLGLSITHDIVVGQHKGKLELDTRPGQYTEFTIELPME